MCQIDTAAYAKIRIADLIHHDPYVREQVGKIRAMGVDGHFDAGLPYLPDHQVKDVVGRNTYEHFRSETPDISERLFDLFRCGHIDGAKDIWVDPIGGTLVPETSHFLDSGIQRKPEILNGKILDAKSLKRFQSLVNGKLTESITCHSDIETIGFVDGLLC